MKKQWLFIGIGAVALALIIFISQPGIFNSNSNVNSNSAVTTNVSEMVTTVIENGTSTETFTAAPQPAETALQLLQRIAQENNITLDIKHFSFGDLVNGINGIVGNDATGQYWSFYVNNVMSDVGASAYQPKAGDTLGWRYQKL